MKGLSLFICAREFRILEQFRATMGNYLDEVRKYLDKNYEVVRTFEKVTILRIKTL